MTGPYRTAAEGNANDFVSREKDRKRREIEGSKEWKYFNAWWEAYKIELAKCPLIGPKALADAVEREYRERYDSAYAAVEAIWKDFQYP